jgi:hypothetical protein
MRLFKIYLHLASRVVDMSKRMSEDEAAGASLVDLLGDDDDDFHG